MQDEEPINVPDDENRAEENSLQADPNGEPQPVEATGISTAVLQAVGCLVAGGALFLLCGVGMTPCCGANRSSRLQWEERQQEIEQACTQQQQQSEACEGNHS